MSTAEKIEIIFDRDHGRENYGWFAREKYADGNEDQTSVPEDWAEDADVPESTIRAWAMKYYCDPDGMTDDQLQELREAITIHRGFECAAEAK